MSYSINNRHSLQTAQLISRRNILKSFSIIMAAGASSFLPRMAYAASQQRKPLIVYFSYTGNTRIVAQQVQSFTGGDMLELKTVQPYPAEHKNTVKQAEQERADSVHPQLATQLPATIADYDLVFVGYPIWAYSMPMVLHSFFDNYTFPGKTIVPFNTHMGSGLADGPKQIARRCPQATVLKGLAVRGSRAADAAQDVRQWLQSLGLLAA